MQYLSQRLAREPAKEPEEGRPAGALAVSQRQRILAATEQLIGERGCAGASIEAIVKAAGVSSVTFYEHFDSKDECFVAAFERAVEGLREAVPAEARGRDGVRDLLAALLTALDADPARARLCFVEAQKGGPLLRGRYDEVLDAVAAEIDDPLGPAIAGGVAWLIRERLEQGGGDGVAGLLAQLTETVLDPYFAHA